MARILAAIIMGTLVQASKPPANDPQSLRGNDMYTSISMLMAADICSDHPADTIVWILDYRQKHWMPVTCAQWSAANSKSEPRHESN